MTENAAVAATPTVKTFADFSVDERICRALADAGIVHPFPIQELTLPLALTGADLIGQARTGTGKTLAFGIPLIQRVMPRTGQRHPGSLVIVPTRELCLQVRDDLAAASGHTDVRVLAVYGGKSIDAQIEALHDGVDIVVGTPGRLLDLLRRGSMNLSEVSGLVLDEADEMLDLGFLPDVEQLIQATAEQRQTLLFSATMPSAVVALARRYMNKPTFMRADVEEVRIAPDTKQHFFSTHKMDKPAVVARILQAPGRGRCVIFSRTKRMADMLVEDLRAQGINAAPIHSDLRQEARERALKSFRSGKTDVLVATEVAARGLDITDVTHVVNYDCPDDEKMYLHRIGRTGRAGAAGVAVTLAVWNELARLEMIKKTLGITEETHEVFSTSEMLDEIFDLPPRESTRSAGRAKPADVAGPSDDEDPADADRSKRPARRPRARSGTRSGPRSDAGARSDASTKSGAATQQETPTEAPARAAAADTRTAASAGSTEVIRRVRTRTRGSSAAATSASPETAPVAEAPATEGTGGDSEKPTRSRTRSRSTTRTRTAAHDAGDAPEVAAEATTESVNTDASSTAAPGRRRTSSGTSTRSGGRGTSSSRSGSARGRNGGRGGSDRRREPARRGGAQSEVDSDAARGDGQPRLSRPLVISYLP